MKTKTKEEVDQFAKDMGCTEFKTLINWHWIEDFPTENMAKAFVDWLDIYGWEHRGHYSNFPLDGCFSVRYR